MLVPRSFKYGPASPPVPTGFGEKKSRRMYKTHTTTTPTRPETQKRVATAPLVTISKPVEIPDRSRPESAEAERLPDRSPNARRPSPTHCSESMPASVAALLAMTTIPPHRTIRARRKRVASTASMSIDELVQSWKSDDTLRPSMSSSPSMSLLLEAAEEDSADDLVMRRTSNASRLRCTRTRSTSSESLPSLDADDGSVHSARSPSTPGSLKSRRSLTNMKSARLISASLGADCAFDHPLILPPPPVEVLEPPPIFHVARNPSVRRGSSFRSNLTTSLQALKAAALNSFSSLTTSNATTSSSTKTGGNSANQIDDALWSHPFLFPRMSSEMRPAIQGTPTQAQRRYLNPMPLTFEEQEAPFQKALHAPFLAEAIQAAPTIQLQTYTRSRRRSSGRPRSSSVDSQSEAGCAQLLGSGIRQREPRENADFLRVVVLEMNMRRAGKLETGRAKIWLPPRLVVERSEPIRVSPERVPQRWQGISA